MKVPIAMGVRITRLSESAIKRRRRRCSNRHHASLRAAGAAWHMTGSRRRDALVVLALMALATAGGVGVAMYTYAVLPG